jgi:UDP-N-acetylglucosamine 2-epimerase (non-hydrolysing)
MKVIVVAGARPNFVKVAPVLGALSRLGHERVLVHTGQHYDYQMSQAFFQDLAIPAPDHFLGVGSASHAAQTARVMEAFEPLLLAERADWVLVPGDVNSTLACALVAVKLKEETGTMLAHLEAGLRSNDWRMPEEANRVLTDHCADLLLLPSCDARSNLLKEGIAEERIIFVGNVMIDTLHSRLSQARALEMPRSLGLEPGQYAVATLHRPSNVDSAPALQTCLDGLVAIADRMPLVLPLHPRTSKQAQAFGLHDHLSRLLTVEPLGYTQMLSLMDAAAVVLTDSGGVQEETTVLGVPCVTLREQTERPVTIERGTNRLAPWPLSADGIAASFDAALGAGRCAFGERSPDGWDGRAADRVAEAMLERRQDARPVGSPVVAV